MASKLLLCLLLSQLVLTGLAVPGYSNNVTAPTTSPYGRPSATGVISYSASNVTTVTPVICPHQHARFVRGSPDYGNPGSKPFPITSPSPTTTAVDTSTPTHFLRLNQRYQEQITSILADPERLCNSQTVRHRASWNTLAQKDRNAYLSAVHCMHRNLTNLHTNVTGSRFRADDFTSHHIVTGGQYVFTGFMLPFHRWMIQGYEDVLRTECGYEGALPYWDFSEHADDITKDPIFSGNAASMGGDGAPVPGGHGYVEIDYPSGKFVLLSGAGGGCLFDQPFKLIGARLGYSLQWGSDSNKTVLYPLPRYDEAGSLKSRDALGFNDRCLTRDLNTFTGKQLNLTHVEYDLSCPDFSCLQERLNGAQKGYPFILNVMNAARSAIGGISLDLTLASPTPFTT
ncbi:hypothetical protein BCR34DRAFT_608405 [Clohesyomyces aquaticus]|uniref:Tyrosinase copper-binding domain-containing protein n=1 Tax=Clohesyomyces aquaticus TaxID=1231657 RepID=A0A1Y1Y7M1_9PLEO|nr:hypothetical protein BCR34DRAFT_608405 [Clohesyomyces aquaticus]